MSSASLQHQLESLYYMALLQNPKTATFKKRAYDTIQRVWERIKDEPVPKMTPEWEKLSKAQKEKLSEFINLGQITAALVADRDPRVTVMRQFMGIYGIGPAKAVKLLDNEIVSIEGLKVESQSNPKLLTKAQKLGLQYYEDLHERIPRREIQAMEGWLRVNVPRTLTWRIVGSYRRGALTSGDVDILVTGEGRKVLIEGLKKANIIRHTLANGATKFMGMAVLPTGTKMRHIDIIETTREQFPFTSLYFTGSAEWNVQMRHQANRCNLRLNEHNYTHLKTGKELTEADYRKLIGKAHPETEEDVCRVIGWECKAPRDRVVNS